MAADLVFRRVWTGLAVLALILPALSSAHGGPGFYPAPIARPPVTGLPPSYIPPGQLPPTYIPPGQLPPWAYQPAPSSGFSIPPDPGLAHRNLLNEEMRLRGWQQEPGRGRPDHDHRDARSWRDEGDGHDDADRSRRRFDDRNNR